MKIVSVLIPTYNSEVYIIELLQKLMKQELTNLSLEIIIVDSSSTDRTKELVEEKFPEVTFVQIPNSDFDHGGTRNYLASLAKGDYYLFMTQDAIPLDNHLIENLLSGLNKYGAKVASARQIPRENANLLERFARNFNYPDQTILKDQSRIKELGVKTFFNSNVCSLYEKNKFKELNGFEQEIILNEDMVFAARTILGGDKVVYVSNAKVYHSHNYKLKQQFKRYFDIGMAFNQTKWITAHSSNEKEGFKMVKMQMGYLLKNKKPFLIIYALIENMTKFVGYRLGKMHHLIPLYIKRRLSAYMK